MNESRRSSSSSLSTIILWISFSWGNIFWISYYWVINMMIIFIIIIIIVIAIICIIITIIIMATMTITIFIAFPKLWDSFPLSCSLKVYHFYDDGVLKAMGKPIPLIISGISEKWLQLIFKWSYMYMNARLQYITSVSYCSLHWCLTFSLLVIVSLVAMFSRVPSNGRQRGIHRSVRWM